MKLFTDIVCTGRKKLMTMQTRAVDTAMGLVVLGAIAIGSAVLLTGKKTTRKARWSAPVYTDVDINSV
jgi:hypothetical protein